MADTIFEKAWGNYTALFEFLTKSDFDEQHGLVQLNNFATLLPYSSSSDNYNSFLLLNASNYVGPTAQTSDNSFHLEDNTNLEYPSKLVDAYQSLLEEFDGIIADAIEPTDLPDYEALEQKVDIAIVELEDYLGYVDGKWADHLDVNPNIPPDELNSRRIVWERERGYSSGISRRKRKVARVNTKLNGWLRSHLPKEYSRLIDARSYFDDENYWVKLPISSSHDKPSLKHYWRAFRMQLPLFELAEFMENDTVVSSTFSTEEEHYKRVETKWKVKAKAKWGIFSGGGSVEKREMEELSEKSSFSCEISFKRFQEVEIFRDRWFQDVLFSTIGKDLEAFWGPGGLLASIPVSLMMSRGMKIEVAISDEYRKKLEKFFASGGSVSFGPFFSGGGSYSKDEKYMDYRKTESGFVLEDNEKTIRILGARVKRFNWSDERANAYHSEIETSDFMSLSSLLESDRNSDSDG